MSLSVFTGDYVGYGVLLIRLPVLLPYMVIRPGVHVNCGGMPSTSKLFPWGFGGKEADTRPGEGETNRHLVNERCGQGELFPCFGGFRFVSKLQLRYSVGN